MKNLKNTSAAAVLMAVLMFGVVSVNAGSFKGDAATQTNTQCTAESGNLLRGLAGAINNLTGMTIFDMSTPACTEISYGRARWS